jgi:predicted acyl esterase
MGLVPPRLFGLESFCRPFAAAEARSGTYIPWAGLLWNHRRARPRLLRPEPAAHALTLLKILYPLMHQHVTLPVGDGTSMQCYVSAPEGKGPFPAIIVLQEAFGVNGHMRKVTVSPHRSRGL